MTSERAKIHVTSRDSSEFTSLVEPYRRELHLHCYRLLGSLHDAEDVVQETMLRAWQHFDTFKGESSLRTWLYRIATNACFDALKKRSPRVLPPACSPESDEVGGQRGTVSFPRPTRNFLAVSPDGPFLTAPSRTGQDTFTSSGSPGLLFSPF